MNMVDSLEIANISDVGKRRPHNEDSTLSDANAGLVILADGMGGYEAGEVASAIAVTTIHNEIMEGLKGIKTGETDQDSGFSLESLLVKNAIIQANSDIYTTAQSESQCRGRTGRLIVETVGGRAKGGFPPFPRPTRRRCYFFPVGNSTRTKSKTLFGPDARQ